MCEFAQHHLPHNFLPPPPPTTLPLSPSLSLTPFHTTPHHTNTCSHNTCKLPYYFFLYTHTYLPSLLSPFFALSFHTFSFSFSLPLSFLFPLQKQVSAPSHMQRAHTDSSWPATARLVPPLVASVCYLARHPSPSPSLSDRMLLSFHFSLSHPFPPPPRKRKEGTPQAPPEYSDSTQLPSTPPPVVCTHLHPRTCTHALVLFVP